jgi:hypothetical protein
MNEDHKHCSAAIGGASLEDRVVEAITEWVGETPPEHALAAAREAIAIVLNEPQEVKDPRIALLETLAKKSRTGVSFDWSPETGYRLMTFHNLRDGCKSISECLERELASQVSRPEPK